MIHNRKVSLLILGKNCKNSGKQQLEGEAQYLGKGPTSLLSKKTRQTAKNIRRIHE
jgi:hypothetical protein